MRPTADPSLDAHALSIQRPFAAPAGVVFRNWIDPKALAAWFAPDGFTTIRAEADPRPGGAWRIDYVSQEGRRHTEAGVFRTVEPARKLVFTLIQSSGDRSGPETLVTVTFADNEGGSAMDFLQTGHRTADHRDANGQGWDECLRKLDRLVADEAAEGEIRALFADWFEAASAKDLDAAMRPLAADIVSYEHDAPLAHIGADRVREVCRRGFELAPEAFRWDVPDLQVIVREDLAVTWGLNHMRSTDSSDAGFESWSRGTRVFRRIDGRWRMIHQHVSYPYDSATGAAVTDLRP